jgi:hypothetical protein
MLTFRNKKGNASTQDYLIDLWKLLIRLRKVVQINAIHPQDSKLKRVKISVFCDIGFENTQNLQRNRSIESRNKTSCQNYQLNR